MKRMGMCLVLLFLVSPCFAATQKAGYLISAELHFKDAKKTVTTKGIQILAKDMNMWTPLNQAEKGIVLLGKKSPAKKGVVTMEFMVIDTTQRPLRITTSSINARLGV